MQYMKKIKINLSNLWYLKQKRDINNNKYVLVELKKNKKKPNYILDSLEMISLLDTPTFILSSFYGECNFTERKTLSEVIATEGSVVTGLLCLVFANSRDR